MTIVEFIEEFMGTKLNKWQIEFVNAFYDACKNGKKLYYMPARGSRFSLLRLMLPIAIYCEVESEKENENGDDQ